MIEWTDSIEKDTDIEMVKANQPSFVAIDWNNPDSIDKKILYPITDIKGSHDPLNMSHSLVFIDNTYQGRWSSK